MALYPSTSLYPADDLYPADVADITSPGSFPDGMEYVAPHGLLVHVGEVLTGRIVATIPVASLSWTDTLNDSGSIRVTVAESVVRAYDLRNLTNGVRNFLAVERDGRIKVAGPIWSRTWDWESGQLTLGAAGIWSWLDKRVVLPLTASTPLGKSTLAIAGKSLGGVARALVANCIGQANSKVPIVLPADESGDHVETFPAWSLLRYGDQLREITQREVNAPDIQFAPRRSFSDPRFLEWVMRVGTAAQPSLSQGGPDWVFDSSVPRSDTYGITTDEDATELGEAAWVTGNGQEEAILLSYATSPELLAAGYPLTEVDESRPTVEDQKTLDGHAANLLVRSARPIEVFKVAVHADPAREVQPGDFCQLVTRGDAWLGDTSRRMRVKSISGDMTDRVTIEMFPLAAFV